MKLKALALNALNKKEIINIRTLSHDKIIKFYLNIHN